MEHVKSELNCNIHSLKCICFVVGVQILSNFDTLTHVLCSKTTYLKKVLWNFTIDNFRQNEAFGVSLMCVAV
jgi:hypothetical protein